MTDHKPLPVHGYTEQSQERVDLVNEGKQLEERVLRYIEKVDKVAAVTFGQTRWTAIGRTHIEQGFMAVFRGVFNPQRTKLPEDAA